MMIDTPHRLNKLKLIRGEKKNNIMNMTQE